MASWLNDFGPLDSVLELERFLAISLPFSWWDILWLPQRKGDFARNYYSFSLATLSCFGIYQRLSLWFLRLAMLEDNYKRRPFAYWKISNTDQGQKEKEGS